MATTPGDNVLLSPGIMATKRKRERTVIGYARVSTGGQDPKLQLDALKQAGAVRIFSDRATGKNWERAELLKMLDQLRPDDVVTVWKLDRLARSLSDLLAILDRINETGAGFRSLTESIDTTTAGGRMMMQLVGAFAEFEGALISERTRAGLEAARRAGRRPGPRAVMTPAQVAQAQAWINEGRSGAEVAEFFGVARSTIRRHIQRHNPADTKPRGGPKKTRLRP